MLPAINKVAPYLGIAASVLTAVAAQFDGVPDKALVGLLCFAVLTLWIYLIGIDSKVIKIQAASQGLPEKIRHEIHKMPKQMIEALNNGQLKTIRQALDWTVFRDRQGEIDTNELDELIKKYSENGEFSVGSEGETKLITSPIDFLSVASNEEDLLILTEIMCDLIVDAIRDLDNKMSFEHIVTPFNGNTSLALMVSHTLRKPLLLVNTDLNVLPTRTILGRYNEGDTAIFVHDVVYTGRRIGRCIKTVRDSGINVASVFSLIERTDEDCFAAETLGKLKLKLHVAKQYRNDD